MKRILSLILAAVLAPALLTSCAKKAPDAEPASLSQSFAAAEDATPAPAETTPGSEASPALSTDAQSSSNLIESIINALPTEAPAEPPLEEDELPLILDPGPGSFPGGLDDDGRGDDEYDGYDEEDDSWSSGLSFLTPVEFLELDANRQYEANIFLSNFAEQGRCIYFYDLDMSQILPNIIDFAHIWYKINDRSAINYGQLDGETYEILTAEDALAVLHRYLILPVNEESFDRYYYPQEHSFYQDGCFFFDAADGEAYNRIAVADSLSLLDDGRYCLTFTEYEIDLEQYFDFEGGIPRSYYELDPYDASQHQYLTRVADGYAIVEPYQYNGRSTYQLCEYTAW